MVKQKVTQMDLQNLVCSPSNCIQLFELLNQGWLNDADSIYGKLQSLTISNLSNSLIIKDINLIQRFALKAQALQHLEVSHMRNAHSETRNTLFFMLQTILEGENLPPSLHLVNLGFTSEEGA